MKSLLLLVTFLSLPTTQAQTPKLLKDINTKLLLTPSDPTSIRLGSRLLIVARTRTTGYEPWISNGTTAGTKLLKDILPGAGSSYPSFMTFCAGRVYFSAYSPISGYELWSTDFTTAGTSLVKDINPGFNSSFPRFLSARNGKIYFQAYTPSTGTELFVSDGTAAGTRLFLDHVSGKASGYPEYISAVGSRKVYFSTYTKGQGVETVVTDGTTTGTKVIDLNPGPENGYGYFPHGSNYRITIGSQVYMRGNQPLVGEEVFTVDNGATAEPIGTPYGSTWIHGSDPVLGQTATITGGSSLENAVHVTLFGSLAARPLRLGKAGFAHFDLARFFDISSVNMGISFKHSLPIPNSPALKGVQLVFQTLSFHSNNLAGTLELSNGLHWAVGN